MPTSTLSRPRKLRKDDRNSLSSFRSGVAELDEWFQNYAWESQQANNAATYITTLDEGVVDVVEEQGHLADGPGAQVLFLSVQAEVLRLATVVDDVVGTLDQHAARSTGRITDAHSFFGSEQLDQQPHHLGRRIELTALFARVVGELLNQVFIGAPEHVRFRQRGVAQIDLGEVLNQLV